MENIQLSICIPTYNFGEFIGQTLESVISQATKEVEIVVVDGASTDNTQEIVMEYQSQYPRLAYYRLEKKGGIDNDMAKTVELAKGHYCWLLSSDDVLRPGAIRRILDEIQLGHAIYLCNRVECDRNLNETAHRYWLSEKHADGVFDFSDNSVLNEYMKAAQSLGALFSYMSTIIVHREKWLEMGNVDDFIGSNYAHVYRLFSIAKRGGKVKYIKESLVSARFDNDSFMDNGIAKRFLIDLDGYQLLAEQLFGKESIYTAFKSVMRREHKWYFLAGLASKVENRDDWGEIERKLRVYDYPPLAIYIARKLGSSKRMMAIVRYFRRILLELSK